MTKSKSVNNIHISQDYLLDCVENNIIMGEATWLTTEEIQLLEGEHMKYDPSDLPQFQKCLDEAVSIVFGRQAYVEGIRFLMDNILVTFSCNETEDSLLLPYECVTATTNSIVDSIHRLQTEREPEIAKREEMQKVYEEKHDRDIYERLRRKFERSIKVTSFILWFLFVSLFFPGFPWLNTGI